MPRFLLTAVFFGLFALLVHAFWAEGSETLRALLFGSHASSVLQTMEEIARQVQTGIPLRDAAVAACRELLHGA